jgi:hypothetical protein
LGLADGFCELLPLGGGALCALFRRLFPRPEFGVMPASILYDPEHWRSRANEMRRIADGLGVLAPEQASLRRAAGEYDILAARAQQRLNSK